MTLQSTLAIVEPNATALLLLVLGVLMAVSVLFSRGADRLGVPLMLLFIVLGMLGGSEALGRLWFDDYAQAVRFGTVALVLILFDAGLNTEIAAVRAAIYPATVLATIGVALTGALVALAGKLFGLSWGESALLGAVVSSTDAAATFAVLRGGKLQLKRRVGQLIELESCINDPMAVILTLSVIAALTSERASIARILRDVPIQLAVGTAVGLIVGYVGAWLLRRARITTVGMYPALTLAIAFLSFGVATLAHGSGFLAVYATAVVVGNVALPYHSGLARVHDSLAWLSQVGMFLMLGLLVFPSKLWPVAWIGLGISLFLAIIARPIAVAICLLPFRYPRNEVAYVSWVGLRGAVPIILATFPVLANVPGNMRVFNIVFFVVVISSLIPGATIRRITRAMKLDAPEIPTPAAVLEINAPRPLAGALESFYIRPELAVCGAKLSEIELPQGAGVVLIVRGQQPLAARGSTVLSEGDHAYLFFRPEDRPYVELLFAGPEAA